MARRSWGEPLFDLFKREDSREVQTPQHNLELARECMEHVQLRMSSVYSLVQFNHRQCDYLVNKLKKAVQSAEMSDRSNSGFSFKCVEVMKLLARTAKEVESFILGCCTEDWVQAALMWANMSEQVLSLGSTLDICTSVDFNHMSSLEAYEQVRNILYVHAASAKVKERAKWICAHDQDILLRRLKTEIHSNNSSDQKNQLAKCLSRRLSRHSSGSVRLSDWEIHFSSLRQVQRLGSGSVGMVRKSIWLGKEVAEKTFFGSNHPSFGNEVKILAGLAHPNIVPLLAYAEDKNNCSIVMELMDGDLFFLMGDRLRQNAACKFPFPISEAVDLMFQTAEGMRYLHKNRIVHRDLKSQNILVKSRKDIDAEYVYLKVADFGLSKTKESSSTYSQQTSNTGTTRWMAPELMTPGEDDLRARSLDRDPKLRHPFKVDVYSFGMVCYEILTGQVPFSTIASLTEVKKMVLNGDRPVLPDQCPQDLRDLICSCWKEEACSRPSFDEICWRLGCLKYKLMTGVNSRVSSVEFDEMQRGLWYGLPLASSSSSQAPSSSSEVASAMAPFKGVRFRPLRRSWAAEMKPPKVKNKVSFGDFKSSTEAARAIDAAFHHYGKPHLLNFADTAQILSSKPSAAGLTESGKLRLVKKQAKWLASMASTLTSTPSSPIA